MLNPGIMLTILALIIEFVILIALRKSFKSGKALIFTEVKFKNALENCLDNIENTVFENIMFYDLIDLIGSQRTPSEIRITINRFLESFNEKIKFLSNLGPVVGLFFTFSGMLLMVMELSIQTSGLDENILNQAFSNLYPVFLGGASGIFNYGYGLYLLNDLIKRQRIATDVLFISFLKFEAEKGIAKPKNLEDAYNQLLKPLTALITKLKSINNGFQNFSKEANNLIETYSEKTTDFTQNMNKSYLSLSNEFQTNLTKLDTIAKDISQVYPIISESVKRWQDSSNSLVDFSKVIKQTEDRLILLNDTSSTLKSLITKLDVYTENVNKLNDWVEKDRLEFRDLKNEIQKFVKDMADFHNSIEQLKLSLKPIEDKLELHLPGIDKNLLEFKNELPNHLTQNTKNNLDQIQKLISRKETTPFVRNDIIHLNQAGNKSYNNQDYQDDILETLRDINSNLILLSEKRNWFFQLIIKIKDLVNNIYTKYISRKSTIK